MKSYLDGLKKDLLSLNFYTDIFDDRDLGLAETPTTIGSISVSTSNVFNQLLPKIKDVDASLGKDVEEEVVEELQRAAERREKEGQKEVGEKENGERDSDVALPREKFLLRKVPLGFTNALDYMRTFYPLLLLEARQAITRAKETDISYSELELLPLSCVTKTGAFLQLNFTRNFETLASRTFLPCETGELVLLYPSIFSNFIHEEQTNYSEKEEPPNPFSPLLPRPVHSIGVVEASSRRELAVRIVLDVEQTRRGGGATDEEGRKRAEEEYKRIKDLILAFTGEGWEKPGGTEEGTSEKRMKLYGDNDYSNDYKGKWFVVKIMNLTTIYREYKALTDFPRILIKRDILRSHIADLDPSSISTPRTSVASLTPGDDGLCVPEALSNTLQDMYNASQFEALQSCLQGNPVTLIQGPPGTGKTTTIMGVLSVMLNARVKTKETVSGGEGTARPSAAMFSMSEATRRALYSPWAYQEEYVPWMDTILYDTEEVQEVMQYPTAHVTDAVMSLKEVEDDSIPRRVLVCAPSNAAIDEIVRRLTSDPKRGGGIFNQVGRRYNPQVVRVGPNVHVDLRHVSLEVMTSKRMESIPALESQSNDVKASYRQSIKADILRDSRIVCCTLNVCGCNDLISFADGFDTVVIDEASQGVEMSTLIPLTLGCRRLVMVGDPRQLPATVFSAVAIQYNYDQSLFQRLEAGGVQVNMLSVQYRMHPAISRFPSKMFYEDMLTDAEKISDIVTPPIPWYDVPIFKPVVFFAINAEHERQNQSFVNKEEANFVMQLIELVGKFLTEIGWGDTWYERIAVITPYTTQVKHIRNLIQLLYKDAKCSIDVNTVDGFQGREKDMIIFSAVRAEYVAEGADYCPTGQPLKTNVGFLADVRRMNVALTRGRCNLWVVGNAKFLTGNSHWKEFWDYAVNSNCLFNVANCNPGYLRKWLANYLRKKPAIREALMSYVPQTIEDIVKANEVKESETTET